MSGLAVQVTQMKYRLSEGSGECFYYIGEPEAAAY
jgi:GTPase